MSGDDSMGRPALAWTAADDPVRVSDDVVTAHSRTRVSDNLLLELDPGIPPQGMSYGARVRSLLSPGDDGSGRGKGRAGNPAGGKPRKAYKEHRLPREIVRQTLSVWDLLLPLLHPPIRLADEAPIDLPYPLYRYQVDGIRFLTERRSALLADEMGTGKTVMSTVALRLLFHRGAIRKALVVVPLSVVGVWDRHLAEWAPELAVTVVHGDTRTRWADWRCPAHVYVTTFDTLRADVLGGTTPRGGGAKGRTRAEPLLDPMLRQGFDLLLLDEAQNIKNLHSGRSQAVRALQPNYRWALTGTPVENRLADLSALFAFVKPNYLPEEGLTPELACDLIGPLLKRRTKQEVMKELPPKIRQDEWLTLDTAQKRAYKEAEAAGREELEALGDKVSRIHVFSLITQLKMICNFAPGASRSPKLDAVVERVEAIRQAGSKVLIFTQWVGEGVDKIAAALQNFGVVTFDARMSQAQREAAIERFRTDPKVTAFVATIKSAGVGLTLTEASYVIHFDHWWNPAWMWQAEDRAHRRGQTEPVNVYSLWMADTIEARIHTVLEQKGVLHETVIQSLSEGAIDGLLSLDDWLEVLDVPSSSRRAISSVDRGGEAQA